MLWFILFIFGAAIGSFLNVVILRYDGNKFLLDVKTLGGRSHCMHCGKTLRWFELVPIASFIVQSGKCRRCGARLSIQYPIVEFVSALVFVFVPFTLGVGASVIAIEIAAIWVAAFESLLVMAVIDIRLGIIPDEINIFLGILGIFLAIFTAGYWGMMKFSFLGPYATIFGWQENIIIARLAGAAFGGLFFAALIAVTRGKGMGMGDLKLAIPLGVLFGWPDIIFVLVFAFVFGAVAGLVAIARGKKEMKGTLPFGPFLALGATTVFFFGPMIFAWYFSLLGIR